MAGSWFVWAAAHAVVDAPGEAPIPPEWSTYFLYLASISATLVGLSFVAVSVHPPLLRDVASRRRAGRALASFVIVLVTALVLARPGAEQFTLTVAMFWTSAFSLANVVVSVALLSGSKNPLRWLTGITSPSMLLSFLAYATGIGWALTHWSLDAQPPSLAGVATYMIVLLALSVQMSWRTLLIGVQRRLGDESTVATGNPDLPAKAASAKRASLGTSVRPGQPPARSAAARRIRRPARGDPPRFANGAAHDQPSAHEEA